jgi:large subunit ribosomal protein L11
MNIKLLVDGGAMKPGPALSQKLGPAGIPINKVIDKVNSSTQAFNGMQVPVNIVVDLKTKSFEVNVFSPPVSGLLKREAGIQAGSGLQKKIKVGNLSIEQVIFVAKSKMPNLLCNDLKTAVKTVIGSCVSLGILVENMNPVEVEKMVDEGKFDKEIKEEKAEASPEKKKLIKEFFENLKSEQDKRLKAEAEQKEAAAAAAAAAASTPATTATTPATGTAATAKPAEKSPAKPAKK